MRKTTHLEFAFLCYLLTFCISNVLVARNDINTPTKRYFISEATNNTHLTEEAKPTALTFSKNPYSLNKFSNNEVAFKWDNPSKLSNKSTGILEMSPATVTAVTCNAGSDGSLTVGAVVGGSGGYQYSINSTTYTTSKTFTGLTAGSYTITVKDSEGSTALATTDIDEPNALSILPGTFTAVNCNGENNGEIVAGTVSGGNGGYTYSIDGINFTASKTFSNLSAKDYTITAKDSKGCTVGTQVTVTEPAELNMGAPTFIPVTCNGNTDGSVTAGNVTGGNSNYTYSVDGINFKASKTFSNLRAKDYTITAKDSKGCTVGTQVTVTEPAELNMGAPTFIPVTCNGDTNGSVTAGNVTGGNSNYTYSIDGINFTASRTFSNLRAKDYSITAKDSKGCTVAKQVTITEPAVLTMEDPIVSPVTCFDGNDASISAGAVSGGNGSFTYSIDGSNFKNSNIFSNLSAKDYIITVKDVKGCTTQKSVTVTQPEILTANVTTSLITCNNASDGIITISDATGGSGAYSYSINNGSNWQSANIFANLSPNSYPVLIRDGNSTNCKISLSTVEITQPFELNADVDSKNVSCNGANDGTITITNATGGYGNFEYSLDGINWQNTGVFENLTNRDYNIQIRDSENKSCTKIINAALSITQPEILTSSLESKSDVLCAGNASGVATVTANGGTAPYTYNWGSLGNGSTRSNLAAGTYTVLATDINGCEAPILSVVINEPSSFLEITNISTTAGCFSQNNATATATVEGGTPSYSYLWDNGQTTQTATNLSHANHTLVVTDANGCSKEKTFYINAPQQLAITEISKTYTNFYGTATGTATVNLTGGTPNYTFAWSNGQTGQTATDLMAGDYSVTVTDKYDCTATQTVTIYDILDADFKTSAVCEDKKETVRTSYFEAIDTRGGSGIYTYNWKFGANAVTPTATGPGRHSVKYNQTGRKTITLIISDGIQTVTKTFQHEVVTCYSACVAKDLQLKGFYLGNQTGIEINTSDCESGINPTGTAVWVDFLITVDRYSLYYEYLFVVTHADGTQTFYEDIVCSPDNTNRIPSKVKLVDIDYNCGDSISLDKIYITMNQNSGETCNAGAAPKCFSISDAKDVTTPFYATAVGTELLCNGSSDGTITVTASGGVKPYTHSVNGEDYQLSNTFLGLPGGSHTIKVKDDEGKIFTLLTLITEPLTPLTLTQTAESPITCFGGTDGSITALASGGTPKTTGNPYTYIWSNGQTTATATGMAAGNYTVDVIDSNGCKVSLPVTIENPDKILANAGLDQNLNCGNTATFLEAVYTNADGDLGEWTIINGPAGGVIEEISSPTSLFTVAEVGTYTLRWTVHCGATDDVKITMSNCSTIDFDGIDDHIDFGNNFSPSSNFSFEVWVKQDVTATNSKKTILSKGDIASVVNSGLQLTINNGYPEFEINGLKVSSPFKIGTDRWYHIAVTWDGVLATLYIDGINVNTGPILTLTGNDHDFLIGAAFNSTNPLLPSNYFHGWIEEVRIWNTALTVDQIHMMMNQKIKPAGGNVIGEIIPINISGGLAWDNLIGYYQMEDISSGYTTSETNTTIKGKLINITTNQERTAPLPYISAKSSSWFTDATWLRPSVWDAPNSLGINGEPIDWNIAKISNNINSGGKDIKLLGLLSESNKLTIANPNAILNEKNSGQALTITHYLDLDGTIDLVGESQLIQVDGSILDAASSGAIERDQQGTASSYNYNYWSSPVVSQGALQNTQFVVSDIMMDGTNAAVPKNLNFGNGVTFADGAFSNPRKVSTYWLYKFHGEADEYSDWEHIGSSGTLKAGEGYTMKGTSGNAEIETDQNYTFKGMPNNGDIKLTVGLQQNFLVGNPYPSAIDADQFLLDNLTSSGGNNDVNVFNGALYFWDHFGGKTHTLREYVGGYATYNLLGGVKAIATDDRINSSSTDISIKTPGRYIPVGQGFFINTLLDDELSKFASVSGGDVTFKNSQRIFVREKTNISVFHGQENIKNTTNKGENDVREKIRISFNSPKGYQRQLLVGADSNATNGFDLGFDAPMNEYNAEDMFWLIGANEFVIQGVDNFNPDQVLPLGIVVAEEGEISIQIDSLKNISDEKRIYLKDNLNNEIHDLRKSDYKSTSEAGYIVNRFELVFYKEEDASQSAESSEEDEEESADSGNTAEETEEAEDDDSNQIEPIIDPLIENVQMTLRYAHLTKEIQILNPQQVLINKLRLYSMEGRLITSFNEIENSKEARISIKNYSTGVYIVKCFFKDKIISKKIIIKN